MIPEIVLSALLLKEQVEPRHHEPTNHIPSESPGEHTHEEPLIAESADTSGNASLPPAKRGSTVITQGFGGSRPGIILQGYGPRPSAA